MKDMVRLGIVGVGNMGFAHINNIIAGKCPELAVTAVADVNPDRLRHISEKLPGVSCFLTAEEMFDSGLIDAALIATPHYFHPELAISCMRRGIHVMVEKPAGVYTKQVHQMNALAEEGKVVFGVMFNQRTDPLYQKMREIVQSGELGAIRRVSWIITDWYRPQAYYDSGSWRATWSGEGGGVLLNQCPHNLDLLQWICGLPVKVEAHLHYGKWHAIEVEDDVSAYFEFENGATGTFITSTGDVPGSNRFEIAFDGGKLLAEGGKLVLWKLSRTEPKFSAENKIPFGVPEAEEIQVEISGEPSQHPGVLNAFAAAILHGEPLIANGIEGIKGLSLSNAMHLSSWTGNPVSLPFDDELFYAELMKRVESSRCKTNVSEILADTEGTY